MSNTVANFINYKGNLWAKQDVKNDAIFILLTTVNDKIYLIETKENDVELSTIKNNDDNEFERVIIGKYDTFEEAAQKVEEIEVELTKENTVDTQIILQYNGQHHSNISDAERLDLALKYFISDMHNQYLKLGYNTTTFLKKIENFLKD